MGLIDRIFNRQAVTAPAVRSNRVGHAVKRAVRMFTAGQTDRLTESWTTYPLPADDVIAKHQRVLVARSREQAANNDYAKSFLRMLKQNVVGHSGIQLQAQSKDTNGQLDDAANQAIEFAWSDFCKRENCDITGKQSLRAITGDIITSVGKDGEFMVKKVFGRDAGKYRFALQVLDPQRCPPDFDNIRLDNGNFVRAGIEFNKYGKPVAYYFTTTKAVDSDYVYGGKAYTRIPAKEIIHGFMPEMVNQKRGLPMMATALWRLNMLNGFEKAALVNARVSSSKGGFFQWREGYGPESDEDEEIFMEAEPGAFQELPAGVEFKAWDPQYPNGEFTPFRKAMLQGIAAGLGVAYNNLAKDLENVNFSSIRQGTLDERDHWKEIQQWLIESFLQPVFDVWLPLALLVGIRLRNGGTLRADQIEKYSEVEWIGRRWQWVDPRADVDAAIKMKNSMLAAPSQILREQGKDPEETFRHIAQDIERMRRVGIPDEFIMAAVGLKMDSNEQQGDDNANE